jgi:hypothetical protein
MAMMRYRAKIRRNRRLVKRSENSFADTDEGAFCGQWYASSQGFRQVSSATRPYCDAQGDLSVRYGRKLEWDKGAVMTAPDTLHVCSFPVPSNFGISGEADLLDDDPIDIALLETLVVLYVALTVLEEREPWPIVLRENTVVAVDQFQPQVTPFALDLIELHVDLNRVVDARGHGKLNGIARMRFGDSTSEDERGNILDTDLSRGDIDVLNIRGIGHVR